ncbi:folylpolyglutamate synthase [Sporothrix bragantina]|uniref:Folylpolyglutamate synthase n=1 Tax=Sporothrix bragantina TaxID=671064 RepID=A0ABP0CFN4_9PEZI
MIDLGLARIGRLLQHGPPPAWKAIHVAGTNGKGSVCAYLSAMLHARGVPSARFTSPHLVDRWDCIVVDERVVSETAFRSAEQAVLQRDGAEQVGATEFELLTATAFEVFNASLSSAASSTSSTTPTTGFGVIECGLGGSLDATTAMRADRAVTVVTRIGLDHQGLLGNTAAAIAAHKAGIMRPGVPCIVDPANRDDRAVRDVLEAHARDVGATLVYPDPLLLLRGGSSTTQGSSGNNGNVSAVARLGLEPHQLTNLACAYAAFRIATGQDGGQAAADTYTEADTAFLASIAQQLRWPGRLQTLDVGPLLRSTEGSHTTASAPSALALLDGAHNPQSADALASYVNKHLRGDKDKAITWILAASHGKDLDEILRPLLRAGDRVAAVTFGPVDGMPWVKPAAPRSILERATSLGVNPAMDLQSFPVEGNETAHNPDGLVSALKWATSSSEGRGNPIVIAGSLYLVSDTLRLLRAAGGETGLP